MTARPGMSATLRQRDFALLWSGQSVSLVGNGIFTVALALETLRIDAPPVALSLVLAARLLPTVLLLHRGVADFRKRRCIFLSRIDRHRARGAQRVDRRSVLFSHLPPARDGNTLWNPLLQELVPKDLTGRSSVDWLVSISLSPVGVLVAELVAGPIGTRTTMLLGGTIATLVAAVG